MKEIKFLSQDGNFYINQPENYSYLYFPIAGTKELKSAVTPNLGGDSKLHQNAFLMEPVSAENLHNNRSGRNFWCNVKDAGCWSAVGMSAEEENKKFTPTQDKSQITAGFMWQEMTRASMKYQLEAKVLSFMPLEQNTEIMHVEITNTGKLERTVIPTAAIPIYGRSADNIRDHRHVTSLLHRINTTEYGVVVKPTLSFDERGHRQNEIMYYVCGISGKGEKPEDFYPTVEQFIGEGGSFVHPDAVLNHKKGTPAGERLAGKEAMGGIRFAPVTLGAGESASYTVLLGAAYRNEEIERAVSSCDTREKVLREFRRVKVYWQEKVNVWFKTGNADFDNLMRWVSFQPFLRRTYGCSFLPHHDYGKGGRGWRDLWQDCLALLIMNPSGVRQMILDNYGGVRMDGTNATIIGEKQGEFIADRNNIARVWMDHGLWPLLTTKLYMDRTGDVEILNQQVTYFKDGQIRRGMAVDEAWDDSYGRKQKTRGGEIYFGSVLEHLLLQNLCAFYEVGEHNHMRLRGADWNDALDMAQERGESVAFTGAYAGNLSILASYVRIMKERFSCEVMEVAEELLPLLRDDEQLYESIEAKKKLLQEYVQGCSHSVSGRKILVRTEEIAESLIHKAEWIKEHIRKTEWVEDGQGNGWYNSYYDNNGRPVEGKHENGIRMMLTGQVFTVMSGTAKTRQVEAICRSADRYLYEKEIGGYRLNTDFHELKYDMGRMFGFAYGEKENGAVFSHMTVMYAYALYQRGFVREGYKALNTLTDTVLNFKVSKIYPCIPEYFNNEGRGMYSYLTGAASWYMLTMVTEVFGVKGELGRLMLQPKLVKEQFNEEGQACICLVFAGKVFSIEYRNVFGKDYGEYRISSVEAKGIFDISKDGRSAVQKSDEVEQAEDGICHVTVKLV